MRERDRSNRFTSAARKATAFRKLGISPDQLAGAPPITQFLKETRGGLKAILAAMRFSEDPGVQSFLAKHDSLGAWARANTCWEAIAISAGVDPFHLIGAALMAGRDHRVTAGNIAAMVSFPDIVKRRIEFAMLPVGWRDRNFVAKLLGMLPIN